MRKLGLVFYLGFLTVAFCAGWWATLIYIVFASLFAFVVQKARR